MKQTTASQCEIVNAFLQKTAKSATLATQGADCFPSGITHDARYLEPYEVYIAKAAGSKKWDVDGNQYIDYAGGHGALLLGHNNPEVVSAVKQQLKLGTHFGANHELEIRWAELVKKLIPCAEKVRFTSSGTEATLLCMRLARAFTGKNKVVRFAGHFHGWHDHAAFGVGSHFDNTPTPGVLQGIADEVLLANANDVQGTRRILNEHDDIAMVIIEPTGSSWGQVPVSAEFLLALRQMTKERDILLVFDEVITGFRCSPGGAQQAVGITPDMTTLAKILAGGLPGGALVGRQDVMNEIDFVEARNSGREKVSHHGTFNGNPLSAAAGIAALNIVASSNACEQANQYAEKLRNGMNEVLANQNVNWVVYGSYSSFHIFTNPKDISITATEINQHQHDLHTLKGGVDQQLLMKLRLAMLLHGVEIFVWPGGPTSAVHTDDDLSQTCDAFSAALKLLKEHHIIR